MENKKPLDLSIEIINSGNGLPGISPCTIIIEDAGGGGSCGATYYVCSQAYMPSCTLGFLGR